MAHFLRTIQRNRWRRHPDVPWLPPGELQGDALTDLRTQGGSLSVYEVRDSNGGDQIAVALAATRQTWDVLEYAIFDEAPFASIGVEFTTCEGTTPDAQVNALHREVRQLTARQLPQVADFIAQGQVVRILPKPLETQVRRALQEGRLELNKFNANLRAKLGLENPV